MMQSKIFYSTALRPAIISQVSPQISTRLTQNWEKNDLAPTRHSIWADISAAVAHDIWHKNWKTHEGT